MLLTHSPISLDPEEYTGSMLLSDRVRITLADEITSGAFEPGVSLDEQQLALRFGASRTPVREALRQLATMGLVQLRPRRGVVVASLSQEQLVDMFEVSGEIEALCVRLATYRMSPQELSQLWQIHEESLNAIGDGALDAYELANQRFHEALYRGTHNSFLVAQALALRERMAAFRRTQLRAEGRTVQSRREHEEVLIAMGRKDADEAVRCMQAHMSNSFLALEQFVARQKLKMKAKGD